MANTELGEALRRWRDRVRPGEAGLPVGAPRRTPGLRREELALLAGISVDYVTRLEQGRAAGPSAQVVAALGRALRLGDDERAHLYRLAGLAVPVGGRVPTRLTPGVRRMTERLLGAAVAVFDASWNLIAFNALWATLAGDPSGWSGFERNIAWRHFTGQPGRVVHAPGEEESFRVSVVGDLRSAAARYPDDDALRALIAELRERSLDFTRIWESGALGSHAAARKTVSHPVAGSLTLDCDILLVPGADLRIVTYTAEPGTKDYERLALLDVTESTPSVV